MEAETKTAILKTLQMGECNHKAHYLGLPFCKSHSKRVTFATVIDKVKTKLFAWKAKVLAFEERGILIKSVAQSLPIYTIQTFLIPSTTCSKVDSLLRDFWWGANTDGKHGLYLKSWHSMCTPKEAGGLGFEEQGTQMWLSLLS